MKGLKKLARILAGLLRELSDEQPYQRHLTAHGRAHSREEWRRFCKDRFAAKYTRPKCC